MRAIHLNTQASVFVCIGGECGDVSPLSFLLDPFRLEFVQKNLSSDVGCVCMLKDWISSNGAFCEDTYNYFQIKLKGSGQNEAWQIYLHGAKSMAETPTCVAGTNVDPQ